eukprot:TRINITY_DN5639_c0_g2_i1.p1 TRINITY_DN5639_c0_g2~~TRINITY_DN5639_c0_g2_i1.p1  ORF type:complete len:491 (+),score=161.36 TRINITY_DN5639_c0_g2_i1:174-1475(+)
MLEACEWRIESALDHHYAGTEPPAPPAPAQPSPPVPAARTSGEEQAGPAASPEEPSAAAETASAPPQPPSPSADVKQSRVDEFCAVSGVDAAQARGMLAVSAWNTETALNLFYSDVSGQFRQAAPAPAPAPQEAEATAKRHRAESSTSDGRQEGQPAAGGDTPAAAVPGGMMGLHHEEAVLLSTEQENALLAEQEKFEKVGDREPLTSLIEEFEKGAVVMATKVRELPSRYKAMRRTRKDGNCFVRAFIFGFLEHCSVSGHAGREEARKVLAVLEELAAPLREFREVSEEFLRVLMTQVRDASNGELDVQVLVLWARGQMCEYAIQALRWIASHHVQKNAAFFEPFVGDCYDYCTRQIEVVGTEFEQPSIIALTSALGVGVRIEYIDNSAGDCCNQLTFPEEQRPSVHLVYKPGHYDLIYPSSSAGAGAGPPP